MTSERSTETRSILSMVLRNFDKSGSQELSHAPEMSLDNNKQIKKYEYECQGAILMNVVV